MIVEELEEAQGRVVEHPVLRRGPDRGAHRQDVILAKILVEAMPPEPGAERRVIDCARGKLGARDVVEPEDRAPEPVEAKAQEVALLRKDTAQRRGPGPAFRIRHRETHVGGFGPDTQRVKETDEVRIVEAIINDEPEVDVHRGAVIVERVRAGVPAETVFLFEDGYVRCIAQRPGCAETRYSRSDDRNFFHAAPCSCFVCL